MWALIWFGVSWATWKEIHLFWKLVSWAIRCGVMMKPRASLRLWTQLGPSEVETPWFFYPQLQMFWWKFWTLKRSCFEGTAVLPCTNCIFCVRLPDQHGRGGGGHGPGGLEGQVPGPGGAAHEVQNADHQDPRADRWQGRWKGTGFWSSGPQVNDAPIATPWNCFVSMFGRLIKTYCTIRKLRWSSVREDVCPPPAESWGVSAMVTSQSHQHWAAPNCSVA